MNFLGYFTNKPRRYKLDPVFFLTPYYLERWPLETGPHFKTHVQFSPTLNTKRSLFEQMRKSCKGNCELYSKVMLVILCEYRLKLCEAARKKQLSKHPTCTSKILVELHSADYDLWCFSFSFSLCSVCYFVVRKFFQGTTFTQFSVRAAECEQSKKGSDNFHDLLSFSTCFFYNTSKPIHNISYCSKKRTATT